MNADEKYIWPEDYAKRWAACGTAMRIAEKRAIKWMRANAIFAFCNWAMAALYALKESNWWCLAALLVGWWNYRAYRTSRHWAALWHECYHHAVRSLQETAARSAWHLEQVETAIDHMNSVSVVPQFLTRIWAWCRKRKHE